MKMLDPIARGLANNWLQNFPGFLDSLEVAQTAVEKTMNIYDLRG